MKREQHYNWKGGLPKCSDCGKELSAYTVKRCMSCYHLQMATPQKAFIKNDPRITGENNHLWEGGKPKCKDCDVQLSTYKNSRGLCLFCIRRDSKGEKAGNWKGGVTLDRNYFKIKNKKWIEKNREWKNYLNHLRRIKKAEVSGTHSFEDWLVLKMKYGFMCLCCKKTEPEIILTEDHIIPISKGGTDDISNIQPLCKSCNSRKGNRILLIKNSSF